MKNNYFKSMKNKCCVWSTLGRHSLDTLSTVSKKFATLLFILMLGVGQMWGETVYYGQVAIKNNALVKDISSGVVQFFNGTVTAVSTISMSTTPGTGSIYYYSNSLLSSDLATSSQWSSSSSTGRYIRGLKFANGTTYTLALGSYKATSITFYGWCGSASKTLTIDGQVYTSPSSKNTFFSHTFTKSGHFTGDVTINASGSDFYGILAIEIIPVYYYRGSDNSWDATAMTPSTCGNYEYIQSSNSTNQFKVSTSTSTYDYNYTYVDKNFDGTDVSNIGDYSKDNCYCWQSGTYYILVYYPNTTINTTNKPKICASTTLPQHGTTTYDVTYKANGGTGNDIVETVNAGASHTVKAANTFSRTNWSFLKWNDGGGNAHQPGDNITVNSDITLYAHWETWSVCGNFTTGGDDNWVDYYFPAVNNEVNIPMPAGVTGKFKVKYQKTDTDPVWYGATGTITSSTDWNFYSSQSSNCGITSTIAGKYNFKLKSTTPTITVTYPTAYTVTYAANGGSGTMTDSNSPYTAGTQVTLLTNSFTAPTGKQFASWSVKDADGSTVSVSSGKFTMPAKAVTVTAQWEDAPTTVTDSYIWKKQSSATGCVTNPGATEDTYTDKVCEKSYSSCTFSGGASAMGRPSTNSDFIMTITAKSGYKITNICTTGKIESACKYSWDGGLNWIDQSTYSETSGETKSFSNQAGASSFIIKYSRASESNGGIWWRNALVTLEPSSAPTTYTVTVAKNENDWGTVSQASVANVASGTSITFGNSGALAVGSTNVTASPASQTAQYTYAFTGWTSSDYTTGGTVTKNGTVTANFTRTTNNYSVTKTLTNVHVKDGSAAFPTQIAYGGSFSTIIESDDNYTLPSDITVSGATKSWNASTGALSLTNVTGAVSVSITGTAIPDNTVYFTPTDAFKTENWNHYAVYSWSSKGNKWTSMTLHESCSGIYTASIPGGHDKIIFVSLKSDENAWGDKNANVASQTVDITTVANNNHYTLPGTKTDSKYNVNTPTTYSTPKYTITYNANGHGTAPDAQTNLSCGAATTAPTAPTADGYEFGGWYKEAGCTNKWTHGTDVVDGNRTLYAKWTEIKVTSITANPTSVDLKYGTSADVTLTIQPDGALDKSIDWSGNGTNIASVALKSGSTYTITGDKGTESGKTLTATAHDGSGKKADITVSVYYLVTFDAQNGSDNTTAKYYNTSGKVAKPADPEKTGNRFIGWFDNQAGTGTAVTFPYTPSDNITLYAKWQEILTPTITFTGIPATVYKGGRYEFTVTTNSDATLNTDQLIVSGTGCSLTGKSLNADTKTFSAVLMMTDAAAAPTITLNLPAGTDYSAKTGTSKPTLGSCDGGGEVIYSLTNSVGSAAGNGDKAVVDSDKKTLSLTGSDGVITLTPKNGKTFQNGDMITFSGTIGSNTKNYGLYIYASDGTTCICTTYVVGTTDPLQCSSTLSMSSNQSTIKLKRYDGTTTTITSMEITRGSGSGGSKTDATLAWSEDLSGGVNKTTADADFTYTASSTNCSGAVAYSSSDIDVATINATTGLVHIVGAGTATITAKIANGGYGCFNEKSITYTLNVTPSERYYIHIGKNAENFSEHELIDGSVNIDLDATSSYSYKVKKTASGVDTWYGCNQGSTIPSATFSNWTLYPVDTYGNLTFTSCVAGTYTFTDAANGDNRTVGVTYPTSYTIAYAGNGATSGEMADQTCLASGDKVNLTTNAFVKTGNRFTGWKDQDDNSYTNGQEVTISKSLTLTAQWETVVTTVTIHMAGKEHKNLEVGETNQLYVTYTPESPQYGTGIKQWSSDNTAVVTVSDAGLVTAVGPGTTKVHATSNNDVSAEYSITVNSFDCSSWYIHQWNGSSVRNYCMTQVGETHEWRTSEVRLPSASDEEKVIVLKVGDTPAKKADWNLNWVPMIGAQAGGYTRGDGRQFYAGLDALGYFRIFDDNGGPNYYLAFEPTYVAVYGKDITQSSKATQIEFQNVSGHNYQSTLFKVPAGYKDDATYKYYVGTKRHQSSGESPYVYDGWSSVDAMNGVTGLKDEDMQNTYGKFDIHTDYKDPNAYCVFLPYYTYELRNEDETLIYLAPGVWKKAGDKSTTIYNQDLPTKTGYNLIGWSRTKNASTTDIGLGAAYNYYKSVDIFYPVWQAKTTTVTLNSHGATTAGSTEVIATYDQAMPSATMPTKTGYDFGGYWDGENGSGTQYYNNAGASAHVWNYAGDTKTLHANWSATNYTVTCSPAEHGSVQASKTSNVHYEETITLTVTPASGYRLATLVAKDANNQAVTITNNQFTMPASNVTVTATFEAIPSGECTELIKFTMPGSITTQSAQTVSIDGKGNGYYYLKNSEKQGDGYKLCDNNPKNYIGVALSSGNFASGDVVTVKITKKSDIKKHKCLTIFADATGSTVLGSIDSTQVIVGNNEFTLTQNASAIYVVRTDAYNQNPYIEIISVCRPSGSCITPTIVWNNAPVNGKVGDADQTITVTTNQTSPTITWASSNESVATITNGVLHLVAAGTAKISAKYTGDGTTYCATEAKVEKTITVSAACTAPSITAQPKGAEYTVGGTATALSVTATGTDPLSYQWQKSSSSGTGFAPISGATNSTYTPAVDVVGTTYYKVEVTNSCGTATSNEATIVVSQDVCPAPEITTPPVAVEDTVGKTISFTIAAKGAASYQWYKSDNDEGLNRVAISGATSATYNFTPQATGTYYYSCEAIASCGTATMSNYVSCIVLPKRFLLQYVVLADGSTTATAATFTNAIHNNVAYYIPTTNNFSFSNVTISEKSKSSMSSKLSMPTEEKDDTYISLSFVVKQNYKLQFDSINIQCQPVSNLNHNYKVQFTDASNNTITGTSSKNTKGSLNRIPFTNSELAKSLVGTVTMKLFAWYSSSDTYRLAKNTFLYGTITTLPTPNLAWTTEPTGGQVGDADKTIAAASTDLPEATVTYSTSNTNIATIVDGKVHYVAAGNVLIYAHIDGNGTTFHTEGKTISKQITVTEPVASETYKIGYVLNGGTPGTKHPAKGAINQDVEVDAPTMSGYDFAGWTVSYGLNTASAFWGTSSPANTALKDAATFCWNDVNGSVFFRNLCSANDSVTLFARWKQHCSSSSSTGSTSTIYQFATAHTGGTSTIDGITYCYSHNNIHVSTNKSAQTLQGTGAVTVNGITWLDCSNTSKSTYYVKMDGSSSISRMVFYFYCANTSASVSAFTLADGTAVTHTKTSSGFSKSSGVDSVVVTGSFSQGTMYKLALSKNERFYGMRIVSGGVQDDCYYLTYCGTSNEAKATSGATYDFKAHVADTVCGIKPNTFVVPDGFTFGGWNTKQDGSGTTHQPGDTITLSQQSDTLYAIWDPQYTLAYDANEGTGTVPTSQTYPKNTLVTVAKATGLSKSGFTFKHWNTKADGTGTPYDTLQTFNITGNMLLYAIWKATETTTDQTYVWNLNYNTCSTSGKPDELVTTQTYMTVTSTAGGSAYSTGKYYTTGKTNGNTITFSTTGGMLITEACIYGKVESGRYARSYNGGVTWDTITGVSSTDADITILVSATDSVSSIMLRNISESGEEGIYLRNAHFHLAENDCTTPAQKTLACAAPQVCKGETATLTIANIEANTTYYLKKDGEVVVTSAQSGAAGTTLEWEVATAGTYTAGAYAGTDNTKTSCLSSMTGTVTVVIYDATISGNKTIAKGGTVTLHAATDGGTWSVVGTDDASINPSTGELSVDEGTSITSVTVQYTVGTCTDDYTLQVTATDCNDYHYYAKTDDGTTDTDVFTKHQGHTVSEFAQRTWVADASHTFEYSGISTAANDTMAVFVIPQGQKGTLYLAAKSSSTAKRNINIDAVAQQQYIKGADTVEHIIISNIASGTHALWSPSGSVQVAMIGLQLCNLPEATKYNFTTNKTELCTGDEFTLTLSGSQVGVKYQLYRNDIVAVGAPIDGSGSAITWNYTDLPEPTCSYKVIALEDENNAQTLMTGTATIASSRSIISDVSEDITVPTGQTVTLQADVKTFYPKGTESYTLQWYTSNAEGTSLTVLGTSTAINYTGEASKIATYQKTVTPASGANYYVLKVTDPCGQAAQSAVIRVTASGANTFTWTLDGQAYTISQPVTLYQGSQHTATVSADEIAPDVEINGTGAEIVSTTISGYVTTVVFNLASNAKDVSLTATADATASHAQSSETKGLTVTSCGDNGDIYLGTITGANGQQVVDPVDDGWMWIYGNSMKSSGSKALPTSGNATFYQFNSSTKISCRMDKSVKTYNEFYVGDKIEFLCWAASGKTTGVVLCSDSACENILDTVKATFTGYAQWLLYTVPESSPLLNTTVFYIKRLNGDIWIRQVRLSGANQGGTGSDMQPTSLSWSNGQVAGATVTKVSGAAPFTITASQPDGVKSLGDITYTSSDKTVATVDSKTGTVTITGKEGTSLITATLAAYGCYKTSAITYTVSVTECDEQAGTVSIISGGDIACTNNPTTLGISGQEDGATIQWYHDGEIMTDSTSAQITVKESGEYYAITHNTCYASSNTITLRDASHLTATAIVDSFYVRKDMPMAPIPLYELPDGVTLDHANLGSLTGCTMLQKGNIVYLDGKATAAAGDYNISIVVNNTCSTPTSTTIKIKVQESLSSGGVVDWKKCKVAFVVTGTAHGGWTAGVTAAQSTNLSLFQYLNGIYSVTAVNGYNSSKKKEIMQYYSQYDMIILTDYLNTKTVDKTNGSMSYSNAIGYMIDIRPVLSFEAFAAGLSNWHIESNPESPKGIQRELRLLCNAHDIFGTPDDPEGEFKADDVVQITTYEGEQKEGKTGLQGFRYQNAPNYVSIATIPMRDGAPEDSVLITCCERQEEIEARMMIFGLNAAAMETITKDGNKIVHNLVNYMLIKEPADLPDCAIVFKGGTDNANWSNEDNWEGGKLPTILQPVRIDSICVVDIANAKAGYVKLNHKGKEVIGGTPRESSITINANAALAVNSYIREMDDENPMPHVMTSTSYVSVLANSANTGALVVDNTEGNLKAQVQMYTKSSVVGDTWNWQYVGTPFNDVVDARYNYLHSYLYSWDSSNDGWKVVQNGAAMQPFLGYIITQKTEGHLYDMTGTLATTANQDLAVVKSVYNVFANSWTAPINVSQFEDGDFEGITTKTIYMFNTGNDDNRNGDAGNNLTAPGTYLTLPIKATSYMTEMKEIPAMAGFFVKADDGNNGTLHLNYDRLVRPTYYGSVETKPMLAPGRGVDQEVAFYGEPVVMQLITSSPKTLDKVYLMERADFTTDYDGGWDGEQMDNDNYAAQIYAVTDMGNQAVAAIPEMDGTVIGFRAGEDSEYTFSFDYDGYATPLYLFDSETNAYTRILTGNTYTFQTVDKAKHNRFLITSYDGKTITTGNTEIKSGDEGAKKIILDEHFYIVAPGRLYDGQGKLVR